MIESSSSYVQLGKHTFSPDSRVIKYTEGNESKLSHKASELLTYLYLNNHRYIPLEELKQKVWEGRNVEDNTIQQAISALRRELKETPQQPFIENKRNEGYRFVAPVEKRLGKLKKQLVIGGITISILAIFSQAFNHTSSGANTVPLTSRQGQEIDGYVFADNLMMSHKAKDSEYWQLYAKKLKDERYSKLTSGLFNDRKAVFSSDGKRVAWHRFENNRCLIMVADFNSEVLKLVNQKVIFECLNGLMSVSLSWKDHDRLLIAHTSSFSEPYRVEELNLKDGKMTRLTSPPDNIQGDYYVNYSPLLEKLVYFRYVGGSETDIWLYDYFSKQNQRIARVPNVLFSAAWQEDKKQLIVRSSQGLRAINVDKVDSLEAKSLLNQPVFYPFKLTENKVGYMQGELRAWDISAREFGNDIDVSYPISSSFHDYLPVYAEESGDLAFLSMRSGDAQVWVKRAEQWTKVTNVSHDAKFSDIAISSDGEYLAYTLDREIYVVDKRGKLLYNTTDSMVYKNPVFSSDGSKLYYSLNINNSWRIEERAISNLNQATTVSDGYIVRPVGSESKDLLVIKFNDPAVYWLDQNGLSETSINLGDIQYKEQIAISENQILFSGQVKDKIRLLKYDFITQEYSDIMSLPSRKFAFNQQKNIIYSEESRNLETDLYAIETSN